MSFSNLPSDYVPFRVYCVCGGFGFPFGTASTKRIRLIGRCIVTNGNQFHVLHIGPSSFDENKQKVGEIEGLTFEYLSPSIRRPSNSIRRVSIICGDAFYSPFAFFSIGGKVLYTYITKGTSLIYGRYFCVG